MILYLNPDTNNKYIMDYSLSLEQDEAQNPHIKGIM